MSKRVKREGQNILDWLDEQVASSPEAQAAYEEETTQLRLAGALRQAREHAGMTQEMVADAMGVRQSLIAKLERANHNHTVRTAIAYLNAVEAKLILAVVTADDQHVIPASTRAEDVVLVPEQFKAQAQAQGMSLREHTVVCLSQFYTGQNMSRMCDELEVQVNALRSWTPPPSQRIPVAAHPDPTRVTRKSEPFAQAA